MLFRGRFGRVLGRVLGGFWVLLSGFQGFEDRWNFEAEVGTRKSGSRLVKGASRGGGRESRGGSGGPNIGEWWMIIHRWNHWSLGIEIVVLASLEKTITPCRAWGTVADIYICSPPLPRSTFLVCWLANFSKFYIHDLFCKKQLWNAHTQVFVLYPRVCLQSVWGLPGICVSLYLAQGVVRVWLVWLSLQRKVLTGGPK